MSSLLSWIHVHDRWTWDSFISHKDLVNQVFICHFTDGKTEPSDTHGSWQQEGEGLLGGLCSVCSSPIPWFLLLASSQGCRSAILSPGSLSHKYLARLPSYSGTGVALSSGESMIFSLVSSSSLLPLTSCMILCSNFLTLSSHFPSYLTGVLIVPILVGH